MEQVGTVEEVLLNVAVGGQMGNQDTHLVPPHAYARGLNVITRNGHCQTRYGWTTRLFSNVDSEHDDLTEFQRGKFQGSETYQSATSLWLMVMVSGQLYKLDMIGYTIECVSRKQDDNGNYYSLNENVDRCYLLQADRFFIVQDGLNPALILDGDTVSWANPKGTNAGSDFRTVPIGTIMAYGHYRLFIKNQDKSILAGDILLPDEPISCLRFTETDYLAQGGALNFPGNLGNITGMKFIKNTSSGDGAGELRVFGEYGVAGYEVGVPRENWLTTDICKVVITEHGGVAPAGIVSVNQDLVYQSADGIRSLKLNMTEMASLWYGMLGTRILSVDVQNYTKLETPWLTKFISGCQWDNRMLMTSGAMLLQAEDIAGNIVKDYGFTGVLSLDFMNVSEMDKKLNPVWDGMWSRYPVLQINQANFRGNRCFITAKDYQMQNLVMEIDKEAISDDDDPIYCQVATRGVTFSNQQVQMDDVLKQIRLVEGWFQQIYSNATVAIFFKTDDYPVWLPFGQRDFCAPIGGQDYPEAPWMPQSRVRASFQEPPQYSHPATGCSLNRGYILELLITWSGHLKVEKIRLKCIRDPVVPEDIGPETCNLVSTLIPQINDSGTAFTDPSKLAALIQSFSTFLQVPWEYPSTFEVPPQTVTPNSQGVIGNNPLVQSPYAPAYRQGPQPSNPKSKKYCRWQADYKLKDDLTWDLQTGGHAITLSSTQLATTNASQYYSNRDACTLTAWGKVHEIYGSRTASCPGNDINIALLPGANQGYVSYANATWKEENVTNGSWNQTTQTFTITDDTKEAGGILSKAFAVGKDTPLSETVTLTLAFPGASEGTWNGELKVMNDEHVVYANEKVTFATADGVAKSLLMNLPCGKYILALTINYFAGTRVQYSVPYHWICVPGEYGYWAIVGNPPDQVISNYDVGTFQTPGFGSKLGTGMNATVMLYGDNLPFGSAVDLVDLNYNPGPNVVNEPDPCCTGVGIPAVSSSLAISADGVLAPITFTLITDRILGSWVGTIPFCFGQNGGTIDVDISIDQTSHLESVGNFALHASVYFTNMVKLVVTGTTDTMQAHYEISTGQLSPVYGGRPSLIVVVGFTLDRTNYFLAGTKATISLTPHNL